MKEKSPLAMNDASAADASPPGIVLIVDDVPENLAFLHDALDEAGYLVLVATDGESALVRARQSLPDVVLLDALMPGMDGFEVARRLKADFATRAIPLIFMTGLSDTEHIVAAFAAGSADYVTKPIRPAEVLARIAAHVRNARQMRQARNALDAFGQATVAIDARDGRLVWQTPLARQLIRAWFAPAVPGGPGVAEETPPQLLAWARATQRARQERRDPAQVVVADGSRRLLASFHDQGSDEAWLVVLREENDARALVALVEAFHLTTREAEVLYWVIRGKTNRDIGDILGASPRTVHKHLEHVFEKLGVETRTAAASMAMARLRGG
jgi:DNA-binding NarL/FixJ family response regulator